MKKIVIEKSVMVFQEFENGDLIAIAPRKAIHKDTEMTATLSDGRRVWFDIEKQKWIIPYRVAKGEVAL